MKILTRETGLSTEPAEPITLPLTDKNRVLIQQMITTSIEIGGYGLAAPQVGVNKQLFVYRTSPTGSNFKVVINPKIIASSGKTVSKSEGCLSAPDVRKDIKRSKVFTIKCINETELPCVIRSLTKKTAIILQHECDHLIGKTILDR